MILDHVRNFMGGIVSVLTLGPSPLYRYPYRNSAEAFRGDWGRIGKDISYIFDEIQDTRDAEDD